LKKSVVIVKLEDGTCHKADIPSDLVVSSLEALAILDPDEDGNIKVCSEELKEVTI